MKRYATYKPTGIAWLPQIPEHWNMFRGKRLFRVIDDRSQDGSEELLTVSHITGVTPRSQKNVTMFQSESLVGYKRCQVNDLAANTMWMWQGAIGVSKYAGVISPAYDVYRQREDFYNPCFLDMLLRTPTLIGQYHALSTGIQASRLRLYPNVFLTINLPLPPRDEQDQIVRFLDWKMARINKLISIKNKQIEKLKYLKFFYISKAVTNGIDDHGILSDAFFGLQWSRVKIGYKAWIRARLGWRGLKATEYVEKGYPFLSAFNIVDDKLSWVNLNFINQYRYDESPEIKLSVGDILLVKDGAGIGKCARIDNLPYGESTPNGSLAVITPKEGLSYKYLYFYFISNHFKNAMNKIITGMGVPHLTQHFLKNVEIPCPPLDMQNKIVAYLDTESKMFNSMIAIKKSEIDKLKELRLRLISDVVTGKIDVRDIEIPEYESVEDVLDENTEDAEEEEMTAVEEE